MWPVLLRSLLAQLLLCWSSLGGGAADLAACAYGCMLPALIHCCAGILAVAWQKHCWQQLWLLFIMPVAALPLPLWLFGAAVVAGEEPRGHRNCSLALRVRILWCRTFCQAGGNTFDGTKCFVWSCRAQAASGHLFCGITWYCEV